jgi:hypothetical protein
MPAWSPPDSDRPAWSNLLIVVLLVAGVAYFLSRRSADFTIRLRRGQVDFEGKVPQAARPGLTEFLTTDLGPIGDVAILGSWRGRRLRLWFHGSLTDGQKQRIRNLLLTRL